MNDLVAFARFAVVAAAAALAGCSASAGAGAPPVAAAAPAVIAAAAHPIDDGAVKVSPGSSCVIGTTCATVTILGPIDGAVNAMGLLYLTNGSANPVVVSKPRTYAVVKMTLTETQQCGSDCVVVAIPWSGASGTITATLIESGLTQKGDTITVDSQSISLQPQSYYFYLAQTPGAVKD